MSVSYNAAITPIVFLDIDGVLNVTARRPAVPRMTFSVFRGQSASPHRHRNFPRRFSAAAIKMLDHIVSSTGAQLVLSSSWRTREDAREALALKNVQGPWHVQWRTDAVPGPRGEQIERWLEQNGRPCHVILDDWPHELTGQSERLVLLSHLAGLTADAADKAIGIIRRQQVVAVEP